MRRAFAIGCFLFAVGLAVVQICDIIVQLEPDWFKVYRLLVIEGKPIN